MTKAEKVRTHRLCIRKSVEFYCKYNSVIDSNVTKVFDLILDILEQRTKELIMSDFLLFESRTLDPKEYAIHKDGFYNFKKCLLHFDKEVDANKFMDELKQYIDKQDGYYAKKLPYQRYYNEPMTHYLQIGIS